MLEGLSGPSARCRIAAAAAADDDDDDEEMLTKAAAAAYLSGCYCKYVAYTPQAHHELRR